MPGAGVWGSALGGSCVACTLRYGPSLLAFALGSQPLSVGPQRLTPDLHAGQLLE